MVRGTTTTFTAAIQGIPQVGGPVNDVQTVDGVGVPKFAVGYLLEAANGDRFRYCHFGAAVGPGKVCGPDFAEGDEIENAVSVVASASAQTTTDGTIGSYYIEATTASVTSDMYAGAKLVTANGAGEGYSYFIKGNTATGDPASGNIRLSLKTPLKVAVTTASDVVIAASQYSNVKIAPVTTTQQKVTGVCRGNVTAAHQFGWVQTRGISPTLIGDLVLRGEGVVASTTTAGAVDQSPNGIAISRTISVGVVSQTAASASYGAVDLRIE